MIIYGSFIGRTSLTSKEVTYTSPRLPSGFRWLPYCPVIRPSYRQLARKHFRYSEVSKFSECPTSRPDCFHRRSGNHRAVELNDFQDILAGLKAGDGVYSILGNHDYGPYFHWKSKQDQDNNLIELKQRQAAMGWKLLNNEHTFLIQGSDSIALIGVENEGEPPFSPIWLTFPKRKQGTEGMFKILLSHNPTIGDGSTSGIDIDLMLAGHTHAMQLQLGNYSPFRLYLSEWEDVFGRYSRALRQCRNRLCRIPFRFGAWPEITVLTLRR